MFKFLQQLSLGLQLLTSLEGAFTQAAAGTKPDLSVFATDLINLAANEFKVKIPPSVNPITVADLLSAVIMLFFPASQPPVAA